MVNEQRGRTTKDSRTDLRAKKSFRLRRVSRYTAGGISITQWTRLRFYLVGSFVALCFCGVAYRAYGLQVTNSEYYVKQAERQHLRTIEIPAPRGSIYDRNGDELAVNADVESIFVNPRAVVDVVATSQKLAKTLHLDVRDLEARLASKRYFAWVKRHVTPAEAQAVKKLNLAGVSSASEPRRFYPNKRLAGHVLGFAGIDGNGLDGLELAMDEVLTGTRAKVASLRDASGRIMVDDPKAMSQPGSSITLTIDRSIQFAVERAIKEAAKTFKAKSAMAIVTDVRTGDVLAIASYPDFDPNAPSKGRQKGGRNRVVTDSFEIGSIMKVFSIGLALDSGVVSPRTVIDTERGRFKIGRKLFRDSFHDEELSVGEVLKRSSNIGALKIAQRLGAPRLHRGLIKLGFGSRTDIELPGEASGVIHPHKRWGELGLATHSYGYGMTSTLLQVNAAMAAVGNRGIYFEPRIIREVADWKGTPLYSREAEGRRVFSTRTTKQLLKMLETVFEGGKQYGTARGLYAPGYRSAGKTGTAYKYDTKVRGYGKEYLSSFSGVAPTNAPRIAVTVLVDEPKGEHYGGKVAGPAWIRIISESLAILGVPADSQVLAKQIEAKKKLERRLAWRLGVNIDRIERDERRRGIALTDDTEAEQTPPPSPVVNEADVAEPGPGYRAVPNFTGMSLAKAIAVAKEAGIAIEFKGSGSAIDQSVPPGATRNPGVVTVVFTSSDYAFAER